MPGETLDDALAAAKNLKQSSVGTLLTSLGENITEPAEATRVVEHYIAALEQIRNRGLGTELSVKLTQLGLDLGKELCFRNLKRIVEEAGQTSVVWIDMEASNYVDVTLEIFRRVRQENRNVGICLQAYLHRTEQDLVSLIPLGPAIRLVKGAYLEPPDRAFPKKEDVDENYFGLSERMLSPEARAVGLRAAFATHDLGLIRRIIGYSTAQGIGKESYEFQMLYGVQRGEQYRLAREGWKSFVLIAYGPYWFPWYMRRLAERPANAWFVVRNLLSD
jgi:proline dehydrogenase